MLGIQGKHAAAIGIQRGYISYRAGVSYSILHTELIILCGHIPEFTEEIMVAYNIIGKQVIRAVIVDILAPGISVFK
jgi:hypothetical protein